MTGPVQECPGCDGLMVDLANMPEEGNRGPGPCRYCDGMGVVYQCPDCSGDGCGTCDYGGYTSQESSW